MDSSLKSKRTSITIFEDRTQEKHEEQRISKKHIVRNSS